MAFPSRDSTDLCPSWQRNQVTGNDVGQIFQSKNKKILPLLIVNKRCACIYSVAGKKEKKL